MKHSRDLPQFYLTAPAPCPYLDTKLERKVFTHLVGARAPVDNNALTLCGFRRSQNIAYRPACEDCNACVSVRVLVNEFSAGRSFRRNRGALVGLTVIVLISLVAIFADLIAPHFPDRRPAVRVSA